MKKLLFFVLIAVTATSISSCSKDDDTKPSLEGSWYIYKESIVVNGETVHEEIQEGCDAESHFQILADNSVVYRNFIICNGYTTVNGTYYPEEDQVILSHEGEDSIYEVGQSNGELQLSITYNINSDDEEEYQTTVYHCKKGEPMPE